MTREAEQPSTDSVPEGKYVYCIIETSEPRSFGSMVLAGGVMKSIPFNTEAWGRSFPNTPLVVYDLTRENVFAHEQVNEAVMREFTVLPWPSAHYSELTMTSSN